MPNEGPGAPYNYTQPTLPVDYFRLSTTNLDAGVQEQLLNSWEWQRF